MASGFVTSFLGISLQLRYYLAGLQVLLSLHPSASTLEVLGSSPFTLEVLGSSPSARVSASFDGLSICNIVL